MHHHILKVTIWSERLLWPPVIGRSDLRESRVVTGFFGNLMSMLVVWMAL